MDNTLFLWVSVVVISVVGTLAHFIYDWMKNNRVVGLFAAVNESTWEHIKIAITAVLLWSLVDGAFYGDNPNYFLAKIASLFIITFFIAFVFYSYRRVAKNSILVIDIAMFYVAIILAQLAFFGIIGLPAQGFAVSYISVVLCFVFFGAYMTLTLMPLKQIVFRDPLTGQYGFRAHRNFFKGLKKLKGASRK